MLPLTYTHSQITIEPVADGLTFLTKKQLFSHKLTSKKSHSSFAPTHIHTLNDFLFATFFNDRIDIC